MGMPFNSLVIRSPYTDDLLGFASFAERAAAAGVTHITVTELPRSFWELDDPADPYLHWSIVHASAFKIVPPKLLQKWVPISYAREAQRIIEKKSIIVKRAGLRAAAFFYDPMYWPEDVFRAYPHLRGPRVDQPRRSIHARFSPCIDHPEVLALYRNAFKEISSLTGNMLDTVVVRTNDSGTGLCWSEHLYNHPNGPQSCRGISHIKRTEGFCSAIRSGAQDAGGDMTVYLGGAISNTEARELIAGLPEGLGYYEHLGRDIGGKNVMTGFQCDFTLYPVHGMPRAAELAETLERAAVKGFRNIILYTRPTMFGSDWHGDAELTDVIGGFLTSPTNGPVARTRLLCTVAQKHFGDAADIVAGAWLDMQEAGKIMSATDRGMNLLFLGSLAQRWLTRPFTAVPEKLTDAEKAHYKRHLFQANERHESDDMLDVQGYRQFEGIKHLEYFNKIFSIARARVNSARAAVTQAAETASSGRERLLQMQTALTVFHHLLVNISNTVNFQIHCEEVLKIAAGGRGDYFRMRAEVYSLMRSEIDNSLALAEVLEHGGLAQMEVAVSSEEETPFCLSPDIAAQLRRKAGIMLDHWRDLDTFAPPPNL